MITEILCASVMFLIFVLGIILILTNGSSYYEDNCGYKASSEMMKMLHENTKDMRDASVRFSTWKWPADVSVYNPTKTVDAYISPKSKRFAKKVRRSKLVNRG